MKKIIDPKDKICVYCDDYEIIIGTGPFCRHWKKVFPQHREWIKNKKIKPAGERTCDQWK